jgi:UDP-N-acetylmuramyl pentapeptide phosphotransferase/UDP-N-acetylglucosamine-1-phosphate transferase
MRKRDDILYPSLDNQANAFISLYAKLSVFIDYELTKDEVVKKLKVYDYPDKIRKFHKKPVPMLGGSIVFFSFTIIFIYGFFINNNYFIEIGFDKRNFLIFFTFSLIFFLTYLFDDIKAINPNFKLFLLSIFVTLYLPLDNNLILTDLRVKFMNDTISL